MANTDRIDYMKTAETINIVCSELGIPKADSLGVTIEFNLKYPNGNVYLLSPCLCLLFLSPMAFILKSFFTSPKCLSTFPTVSSTVL